MKIGVDLRTIFNGLKGAAQAYVMLSRVQCLQQLYIIEELPENKIIADPKALVELDRLDRVSINQNPQVWEQIVG